MSDLEETTGRIIERTIAKEMKTAYIDYAMSVIVARALPDARDGLKPVHRRILYSMHEGGYTSSKPYRKSASIVGDTLGKYHPHGDSSVYDAMVRLAQDFSMRYTLVDGHGNFGSIDGDPAAANRYTEARMSKISERMLLDIEKDTVDFVPNYDDSKKEPSVLPTRIPQLLVNGSSGIAVGMASNIPPHNLTEVINGCIAYLGNEDITIPELMEHIKGPDFPTGALILGTAGIKEAYETGRGKIKMRGECVIEQSTNVKQKIVIHSLPYQVNKAKFIENIAQLVKEKKVEGISDLRDESDRNALVRVVIELKKDANAQVILNKLYKHTQLQSTFGVINLALVNQEPKILNLKESIKIFIDHREEVVLRRAKFELKKAEARLHILEGLKIAIENIDEVIRIIKSAYDDAKERLMKRFKLSDVQAQAILDMRLKTLTGLQIEKIEEEYNALVELVKQLNLIIESKVRRYEIIKEELEEILNKFGDARKTKIVPAEGDIDIEDLIKEEQTVIALTHFGYIKRMPIDTYKSQNRGGKGIQGITTREEDFVKEIFTASTHDNLLFFTNQGRVYQLKGYEIPEAGRTAKGTAIVNIIALEKEEKVEATMAISKFEEDKYLIMATESGMIKKTKLKEYDTVRKSGLIAINLKENDRLINVRLTSGDSNVIMVTKKGKAITFKEQDVRETGRASQGVIGMRLHENDMIVGMDTYIDNQNMILTISESGFGKRTELEEYRLQKRGGAGVLTYNVTRKTGDLVGMRIVDGTEDLMLITNEGTIIRIHVKGISVLGRSTQGVTLIRTGKTAKVVSIETIEADTEA
ncbi:MAG: DNA gyrase subunit A [Clostridium sp.]